MDTIIFCIFRSLRCFTKIFRFKIVNNRKGYFSILSIRSRFHLINLRFDNFSYFEGFQNIFFEIVRKCNRLFSHFSIISMLTQKLLYFVKNIIQIYFFRSSPIFSIYSRLFSICFELFSSLLALFFVSFTIVFSLTSESLVLVKIVFFVLVTMQAANNDGVILAFWHLRREAVVGRIRRRQQRRQWQRNFFYLRDENSAYFQLLQTLNDGNFLYFMPFAPV